VQGHDVGPMTAGDVPASLRRVGDRLAVYASSVGLERWTRIGAAALVPLLLSERGRSLHAPLLVGLSLYVLLTAVARRDRGLRVADLLAAALVTALAGPEVIAFLPFLMVTVAAPAARGGIRAGLVAATMLSCVLLVRLVTTGDLLDVTLGQVLPIATLLYLAGITTAVAAQILADRSVQDRLVLQQANRLLSSLRAIADHLPGGLDASTIGAALVAELREVAGARAMVVYVEDHGVLRPTASAGLDQPYLPTVRVDELRRRPRTASPVGAEALPQPLRQPLALQRHWVILPLGASEPLRGVLLVGFPDRTAAHAARTRLLSLAADGGLALENARLFDGTRSRATEIARRHVAADLHDGVAQSLAHLRMELELMAMADPAGPGSELDRLARLAATALSDLRATIAGLDRAPAADLPTLLRRYLEAVDTPHGPRLELSCPQVVELDPDRNEQLLRITQEAVSNALRHASAGHVLVRLTGADEEVELRIEDDGVGRGRPTTRRGGGVGMRSMRQRAEALGGALAIADRPEGGTVVAVRFPARLTPSTSRR
jgi:signal transduction histidine kinase